MKAGLIRSLNTSHYTESWRNDIGSHQRLKAHNRIFLPPLGIAMLKSYVESKGFRVFCDDINVKAFYDPRISKDEQIPKTFLDGDRMYRYIVENVSDEYIEETGEAFIEKIGFSIENVDLFGISCEREQYEFLPALVILKLIKERYDVLTALGGWQKGDLPEAVLQLDFVDFLCIDEGEYPLEGLLRYLNNEQVALEDIKGLAYKKGNTIHVNQPCSHKEKHFESPDFDGLPLDLYRAGRYYPFLKGKERNMLVLPFQFIRGCPNNCAFCKESSDNRWYSESPEDVARGLEQLKTKYCTPYFFFLNNEFNPTYKYAAAVCDEIIERGTILYWTDCVRFDNMDEPLLKNMREAGAQRLIWGLESGSPKISQIIHKRIDLNMSESILHHSHDLGIWNGIEIIVGFPFETKDDLWYTINYLKRNREYIDTVYLNHFILFTQAVYGKKASRYKIALRTPQNDQLKTAVVYDDYMGCQYDHVKGLSWEEKVDQTDGFFNLVNSCILPTQRAISFMDLLVYKMIPGGRKK